MIRGDDLLDSTGRQIQLARLLGRARPPIFLHHPLIMKSATQKLSKADATRASATCAPPAAPPPTSSEQRRGSAG